MNIFSRYRYILGAVVIFLLAPNVVYGIQKTNNDLDNTYLQLLFNEGSFDENTADSHINPELDLLSGILTSEFNPGLYFLPVHNISKNACVKPIIKFLNPLFLDIPPPFSN